jgi:integrase
MASLYKRAYWSIDPETGERVRKKTANWYGKYKNADGIQVRVPLSSNKVASEQMLAELVRTVELGKAGLIDPFETHRKRPLREHLTDFRQHLESKGNSEPHVGLTVSRVTAALTGAGFKVLGDLNADKVSNWLKKQRDNKDKKKRFGVATSNHYLVAVKSFGNWLLKSERLERNPFVHLSRLNSRVDVRVKRRALDPEELTRLIDAAQLSAKRFRELTGPDRAALYLVATMTGLRANELATLRRSAFDFTATTPTVEVEAKNEKAGRGAVLPLHPIVVTRLTAWIEGKNELVDNDEVSRTALLWPGTWAEKAAKMVRQDLADARAAWLKEVETDEDEHTRRMKSDFLTRKSAADESVDFHALRHSFITLLASSGVHPKLAQQLARHSTITLTMDRYSHCQLRDLTTAVETLPALTPKSTVAMSTTSSGNTAFQTVTDSSTGPSTGPKLGPMGDKKRLALTTVDETAGRRTPREPSCKRLSGKGLRKDDDDCEPLMKVRPAGFEPATDGLEIRCSIQLSYGRLVLVAAEVRAADVETNEHHQSVIGFTAR